MFIALDPGILPIGIYPKEMNRKNVTNLVTAVLFVKAKRRKQPKTLIKAKSLKIHTTDY